MIYRLIEKQIESVSITIARKSPSVDVASAGGDSISFVVVATAAAAPATSNITLEASLDDTSFIAVGSAVTIAANGVFSVGIDRPTLRYYRVSYAIASGSYTSTLKVLVKGDKE